MNMPTPQYPIVFVKTTNTLIGHGGAIVIPAVAAEGEVDYEAELAVVIGREAKNVAAADALDYVLGYTIANDVTARRWQVRTQCARSRVWWWCGSGACGAGGGGSCGGVGRAPQCPCTVCDVASSGGAVAGRLRLCAARGHLHS